MILVRDDTVRTNPRPGQPTPEPRSGPNIDPRAYIGRGNTYKLR